MRLNCPSPAINVANNSALPDDDFDLDLNPATTVIPHDRLAMPRIIGATVDMGAMEKGLPACPANVNSSGASANRIDIDDLLAVVSMWGNPCGSSPCPADIAPAPCGDGDVDIDDLLMVVSVWGCCPSVSCTPTDLPEDFWDCYDRCSEETNFGECMDDCFKALCELGHTEFCD